MLLLLRSLLEPKPGAGRINSLFTPAGETTLTAAIHRRVAAGSGSALVRLGDRVTAPVGRMVLSGTKRVRVYQPGLPITPGLRSGTVRPQIATDSTLRLPAGSGCALGHLPITIIPRIEQRLSLPIRRRLICGVVDPSVTAVQNPREDEVMALVSLMRQRRIRRFSLPRR
jgi:hypothetical protein